MPNYVRHVPRTFEQMGSTISNCNSIEEAASRAFRNKNFNDSVAFLRQTNERTVYVFIRFQNDDGSMSIRKLDESFFLGKKSGGRVPLHTVPDHFLKSARDIFKSFSTAKHTSKVGYPSTAKHTSKAGYTPKVETVARTTSTKVHEPLKPLKKDQTRIDIDSLSRREKEILWKIIHRQRENIETSQTDSTKKLEASSVLSTTRDIKSKFDPRKLPPDTNYSLHKYLCS